MKSVQRMVSLAIVLAAVAAGHLTCTTPGVTTPTEATTVQIVPLFDTPERSRPPGK